MDELAAIDGVSIKVKKEVKAGLEIDKKLSGNQEIFKQLGAKFSEMGLPVLATGAWRTCRPVEGIEILSPKDESYLTAVSNELSTQEADVTICGGMGYLQGTFGIEENMNVKQLASISKGATFSEDDLGKNTANLGRMIAALAYVEDAGITTDVSINSGNSTMGIVHKK